MTPDWLDTLAAHVRWVFHHGHVPATDAESQWAYDRYVDDPDRHKWRRAVKLAYLEGHNS